jgi:hypothetical protein
MKELIGECDGLRNVIVEYFSISGFTVVAAGSNNEKRGRAGSLGIGLASHWDKYLLGLLGDAQFARGAAYVTPAVGGYYAHESGCEPRLTGRDRICDWQMPWRAAVDNDMVLQLGIPGILSLRIHPFLLSTSPCTFRFRTANSVLWTKRLQEFGGIWADPDRPK